MYSYVDTDHTQCHGALITAAACRGNNTNTFQTLECLIVMAEMHNTSTGGT